MAVQAGRYDHPSYLARHAMVFGKSTAGASAVQYAGTANAGLVFPWPVRVRNAVASIQVAGTSASTGAAIIFFCTGTSTQLPGTQVITPYGTANPLSTATATNTTTATLGYITCATSTPGSVIQSGDMNFILPAGQALQIKNGTDATCSVGSVVVEWYIDPSASWTGGS